MSSCNGCKRNREENPALAALHRLEFYKNKTDWKLGNKGNRAKHQNKRKKEIKEKLDKPSTSSACQQINNKNQVTKKQVTFAEPLEQAHDAGENPSFIERWVQEAYSHYMKLGIQKLRQEEEVLFADSPKQAHVADDVESAEPFEQAHDAGEGSSFIERWVQEAHSHYMQLGIQKLRQDEGALFADSPEQAHIADDDTFAGPVEQAYDAGEVTFAGRVEQAHDAGEDPSYIEQWVKEAYMQLRIQNLRHDEEDIQVAPTAGLTMPMKSSDHLLQWATGGVMEGNQSLSYVLEKTNQALQVLMELFSVEEDTSIESHLDNYENGDNSTANRIRWGHPQYQSNMQNHWAESLDLPYPCSTPMCLAVLSNEELQLRTRRTILALRNLLAEQIIRERMRVQGESAKEYTDQLGGAVLPASQVPHTPEPENSNRGGIIQIRMGRPHRITD